MDHQELVKKENVTLKLYEALFKELERDRHQLETSGLPSKNSRGPQIFHEIIKRHIESWPREIQIEVLASQIRFNYIETVNKKKQLEQIKEQMEKLMKEPNNTIL